MKKRKLIGLFCILSMAVIFVIFFSLSRPQAEDESGFSLNFNVFLSRMVEFLNFFIHIFYNEVFYILLSLGLFVWALMTLIKKFDIFHKKGGFILIYCLGLILIFIWIFTLFSKDIKVFNQPKNNTIVGEMYGKTRIGQTFTAPYNNLRGVGVLFGTYNRKNTGEIIFHLRKSPDSGRDLFNSRVDIPRIKDNKYFHFYFPEINKSKGEKFYFYFETPHSQPGNAVTIWAHSKDLYRKGEKKVDGASAQGDLVFMTVYNRALKDNLGLFLNEITQNKPYPLNKKSFYIALSLFFVFTGTLFLTGLINYFVSNKS